MPLITRKKAERRRRRPALSLTADPYRGATCLLPVLCDIEPHARRAREGAQDEMERLDWVVVSVVDIHVGALDISVSKEQFVTLGSLMVLPDDWGESDGDSSSGGSVVDEMLLQEAADEDADHKGGHASWAGVEADKVMNPFAAGSSPLLLVYQQSGPLKERHRRCRQADGHRL